VLDIRMPDLDGVEFLRRMRRDPRLAAVPVGIVTGDYFLKDDTVAELTTLGASIWYKPLDYDEVAKLARTLLGHTA
jgi:CheY-like chemotaxis protein